MATLYQTTATARKGIMVFLIIAVVILGIEIVQRVPKTGNTGVSTNRCYLSPDSLFGVLKPPTIPVVEATTQGSSYLLEGVYSLFPDVAYVHTVEKPREKLLVFETAQKLVETFGFQPSVFNELGENNYEWISVDKSKNLKFNKSTQSWILTTKFEDNIDALRNKTLGKDLEYYSRQMQRLITNSNWDTSGLDEAIVNSRYAKLSDGSFTEKTTAEESDYIIGNAYRVLNIADLKAKEDLPVNTKLCESSKALIGQAYGDDPRIGQIHVVASENFATYPKDLYSLSFTNFEYTSKKGIYSILTPDEAWNRIQSGSGSLVSLLPQNYNYFAEYPKNLTIKRFTGDRSGTVLGYYEPKEWTGYAYPIYVFEGRAELSDGRVASFTYFVNALR